MLRSLVGSEMCIRDRSKCTVKTEQQLNQMMHQQQEGLDHPKVLSQRSVLCAWLCLQRFGGGLSGEEGEWLQAWVRSLPSDVETAIMWEGEAAEMQLEELQVQITELQSYLRAQLELLSNVQGLETLTWDQWCWGHSICTSRFCKLGTNADSNHSEYDGALVPVVDLLNHDAVSSNVDYLPPGPEAAAALESFKLPADFPSHGAGVLVTTEPVVAGEELRYCYGHKPNLELVRAYGFAQFENPADTVRLELDLAALTEAQEVTVTPEQLAEFNAATESVDGVCTVVLRWSRLAWRLQMTIRQRWRLLSWWRN
eukprot:TRINITY_DN62793_c0_g1_i1.p1 TRINITY_DN62793_c0_g1~~TRINITY_DN62793_c0_g1_i1.p1  ORF type:complete len:312 (-),score=83.52 TRINITY_DN62793_c0_g1_i1:225-1160(-)